METSTTHQAARLLRSCAASGELDRLTESDQAALLDASEWLKIEGSELSAGPKQLSFQKAFFTRQSDDGRKLDIFVAIGGNRSGKSIAAGRLCFAKFLRDEARDGDWFWCVSQTLDRSIGGQQRELWEALPANALEDQRWDEKIGFGMHRKILVNTSDGGRCLVEFRSSDQDPRTFEQAKLRGVWVDEKLPEAIYNRLLPRLVDRNGWLLYSDIPEQWWQLVRLVNAPADAGVYCQLFEMADNAHNLPEGAIEKVSARMTEEERRQRIKGLFVIMEGIVYREFNPGAHVMKPFPIPAHWPKYRAIDYGGSAPTACVWVAIAPNEKKYVYREHYTTKNSVPVNAREILAASEGETYVETLIDPHAIDPPPTYYGVADTIAVQYAMAGLETKGWPYMQGIEHACVQKVKGHLERNRLIVFETCINTIREFSTWKYKCDQEGKPVASDAFENANNHLLDCLKGLFATNPTHETRTLRFGETPPAQPKRAPADPLTSD